MRWPFFVSQRCKMFVSQGAKTQIVYRALARKPATIFSFVSLRSYMRPEKKIFSISNEDQFNELAIEIFRYQLKTNAVYHKYFSHLGLGLETINNVDQIPFLPIEMFREHMVITGNMTPSVIFESSGTTGQKSSKHYVVSEDIYRSSFLRSFTYHYGKSEDLCILALLPSYLERSNSSLVYMMNHLIERSKHPDSGFYLNELDQLSEILHKRMADGAPTLLIGVSFALLDLAEQFPTALTDNITIMETGGMKGKRKEMIRDELHEVLKKAFGLDQIHSEYGMTELLSQAYALGDNRFYPPQWMKVVARDMYDPFALLPDGKSGGINIIDLANIYSCSFIATSDLGKVYKDGSFEVNGRFDQADVRGCNLMVT
jgi:phenylacetate-coenzyme A ligase PaaK-like adenylate-forming protein